jgi:hypothetical protein
MEQPTGPCEIIKECHFFQDNMASLPAAAEIFRKEFCTGDFKECARFIVKIGIGIEQTPKNMFPNEKERAIKMILQSKPNFKFE